MRFRVLCALTIIWFILLSFISFQPGDETTLISGGIAEAAENAFGSPFSTTRELELRIRAVAHPVSFFLLAVLLFLTVDAGGARLLGMLAALGVLIGWSFVSEVIKIPIPGRDFNWPDVIGNIVGVFIGFAAVLLLLQCKRLIMK